MYIYMYNVPYIYTYIIYIYIYMIYMYIYTRYISKGIQAALYEDGDAREPKV